MTGDTSSGELDLGRARGLKSRAFRWSIGLVLAAMLAVGAAFFELLPLAVAYWLALGFGLGSIGATVVYFVSHQEQRE